jgi:endoglucanase
MRRLRSNHWKLAVLASLAGLGLPAQAAMYIRGNTLGYAPERTNKTLLVLADSSQEGKAWQLTDAGGKAVRSGSLGSSIVGVTSQSAFAAHHAIDLGTLRDTGTYSLNVSGAAPFEVRIRKNAYSFFAEKTLGHLRLMRSGAEQSGFRQASHLGDTACIPQKPLVPEDGSWIDDSARKKLDLAGGWYDAGDYIKFTSTTAQTVYFLLRAWETDSGLFAGSSSLLDEARFGLRWLLKTHPDDSTFVVQVGDQKDHDQGQRLPQYDLLDGKRPVLCALSPLHMGITSAALALGANVFRERDAAFAKACSTQAVRILEHGSAPGVARVTYYSGSPINAFYKDDNIYDNLGMGAAELWHLTGESRWKTLARQWADSSGTQRWINWGNWAIPLNARLAGDSSSLSLLRKDMQGMAAYGSKNAKPWNLPMQQSWNPIEPYLSWIGIAADRARAGDTSWLSQAWDTWDYVLGKNNWGTSFLISKNVPHHASSIYNQIYQIQDVFPEGAISLGPGGTSYFTSMSGSFSITQAQLSRTAKLNCKAAVFYDNPTVFLNTETTIDNPATFLFALSALSRLTGDSIPGATPTSVDRIDTMVRYVEVPIPLKRTQWSAYNDASSGGVSEASLVAVNDSTIRATLQVTILDSIGWGYCGFGTRNFPGNLRALDWMDAKGVRVRADIPAGNRVWIFLSSDSVADGDNFGRWVSGKGDTTYDLLFDSLAQRGFGKKRAFVPTQVNAVQIQANDPSPAFTAVAHSLSLLMGPSIVAIPMHRTTQRHAWVRAGRLAWDLPSGAGVDVWRISPNGVGVRIGQNLSRGGELDLEKGLPSGAYRIVVRQGGAEHVVPWMVAR